MQFVHKLVMEKTAKVNIMKNPGPATAGMDTEKIW